jgi:hypothetical protein
MIKFRNLAPELRDRVNDRVGAYRGPVGRVFYIFNSATRASQAALTIAPYTGDEDGRTYAPAIYVQGSTTGVQDAINNCANGYGDVLLFEPGSHNSYAAITLNKTHVSLLGPSSHNGPFSRQTLLRGFLSSADRTSDNVYGPVLKITQGYYRLEGLNFWASTNDSGAVRLSDENTHGGGMGVIQSCGFPADYGVDNEYYGINITGSHYIEIADCFFGGQAAGGIAATAGVGNSEGVFIRNCLFQGCVYGLNIQASAVYGWILDNCTFGTSSYPANQAMTSGILVGAGVGAGEVTISRCQGTLSAADFVTGAGAAHLTVLGESGGYTVLTTV